MTTLHLFLIMSILLNAGLIWYAVRILRKFVFISENLSDLFLTTKAFQVFITSLFGMENYHGEPMIEELLFKIRQVNEEIDMFREIFQYTLDEELEEELNAAAEEKIEEE
jgi:hypothetical protein